MPPEVEKLAQSLLTDAVTVKVNPVSSTVDKIDQSLYMVDKANKKHLLAKLLKGSEVENALVFSRTKHGADRIVRELSRAGIEARSIHGNKSQSARQQALGDFKSGRIRVLVATDIAARGIDIAGLSHVFNYDLPNEPEAYVHRIGRTGRAGLEGTAISFCCIDEMKELKQIEKLIGKTLPRLESEWPMQVMTETVREPRSQRTSREMKNSRIEKTEKSSAPAKPVAMRATPLERPAKPLSRPAAPAKQAAPVRQASPVKAAPPAKKENLSTHDRSYAEMLRASRRAGRRPISTGNDRY